MPGDRSERADPAVAGDIGDRVFAADLALRRHFRSVPPVEVGVAATLPESAGLSSSAAVVVAMLIALTRMVEKRVSRSSLIDIALTAEQEIAGVPCGSLDQQAVVRAPEHGILILDFERGSFDVVPWPWTDVAVVVADSMESHDVAGGSYEQRRRQAEAVLARLGVVSCRQIGDRWTELSDEQLRRRARHISSETARTDMARDCLSAGDLKGLGNLVSLSHQSLRDDFEVSTDRIDAMVEAATGISGCYGSRIVGGGFGGSVIALCDDGAADDVRAAMARAAGRTGRHGTWLVQPSPGVAFTAMDVIYGDDGDR